MAINLGDINFGLGPDTRRLEQARRQVVQFGLAVNQAARQQGAGAREAEAALRRQERALVDSLNKVMKLNDAIRKSGVNPTHFNATTQQINRLARELTAGRVSALQFQRSMEDINTSMGRTRRAIDAHVHAERQAAAAARAAAAAQKQQQLDTMRLERTLHSATMQVERYNSAVARAKGNPAMAGAGNAALGNLRSTLATPGLNSLDIQRASQTFQTAMGRNMDSLRAFRKEGMVGATGLTEALRRLADISILLNGPLGGIAARMSLLSTVASKTTVAVAALVAGAAASIYTFIQLGKAAIQTAREIERVEQALNSLNSMAETTDIQMQYIMRSSDRTGTSFVSNARAYARLQAAAAGTNLEGSHTIKIFDTIIASGAKLNLSQEEVAGTLKAVEQIMSKGTVQAEELRGQLGDRLPGAFGIMARALNLTTRELGDMMKQGEITSDALVPFVEELARTFGVDLTKSIDTVTAAEGRWNNALMRFNRNIDDAVGFSAAYKSILNSVAGAVDHLAKNIVPLVGWLKLGATTIAFMFAPVIIKGFLQLITLTKNLTFAMIGLNAATARNPLGLLAMLLVQLGAAFVGATVGINLFNEELRAMPEGDFDPIIQSVADLTEKMKLAEDATAGFRTELLTTLEMQRAMAQSEFDAGVRKLQEMQASLAELDKRAGMNLKGLFGEDFSQMAADAADKLHGEIAEFQKTLDPLDKALLDLDMLLGKLDEIRKRKGDAKGINPFGTGDDAAGADQIAKAIREATQGIAELNRAYEIAGMSPAARAFATMQEETNKQIQNFRDRLIDAKVPLATVTALTAQYSEALRRVNEQAYRQEHMPDIWGKFADILGGGIDDAFMKFIDNVIAGQNALEGLRDIGKAVATDLLKTFTQLAVLNPLKNALFGGNYGTQNPYPVASFGGGGGIGGFLGGLFSSIFGGGFGGSSSGYTPGFGAYGKFAGGGSFTIPGGGAGRGMDSQLVQFWGSPGEEVHISKRGHGSSGDGGNTYVEYNQHIHAVGNEEVARISRDTAQQVISQYDKGTTRRNANAQVKGKQQRMPGQR